MREALTVSGAALHWTLVGLPEGHELAGFTLCRHLAGAVEPQWSLSLRRAWRLKVEGRKRCRECAVRLARITEEQ